MPEQKSSCCCCGQAKPQAPQTNADNWTAKYLLSVIIFAAIWFFAYSGIEDAAHWVVFEGWGASPESNIASAVEFFLYDTVKILLLLVALIYVIAWLRATLNVEKVRDYLTGKGRGLGYFLGAMFGAVTPFCSCSSIPLFLGFTTARIPFGVTMSFLITSPLINEIAIVLLWGLLGWKFTVVYVLVGLTAGIIGGFFMDSIRAERWLQPFIIESMNNLPVHSAESSDTSTEKLSLRERHLFAYSEMTSIFRRVWHWVIVGVGIGALLHGFVPDNWFAENLGAGQWWSVPIAVLVAIPLYSNVTGIVPVMESLLVKGMPIGTTMAFCMSAVAASIPEFIMLRQIMTAKLQAVFIAYLWVIFTCVGWLFNILEPFITQ
jgi:uncharacterized membrane protein YraQ (UPF0718 family)